MLLLYNTTYKNDYGSTKAMYVQIAEAYRLQGNTVEALNVLWLIVNYGRLVKAGYQHHLQGIILTKKTIIMH